MIKNNLIDHVRQGVIMADKAAIEAIHRLSDENDRLRAEVERLRDGRLGIKRPGNYVKIPKGTIIGPLNIMKIQK